MSAIRRSPTKNIRILAVDDDPLQLRLLSAYLSENGFSDITLASCAADAIKEVVESFEPFDIFLLDIQMPGMDGISLCRHLRGLPEHSDAIVIMLSSLKDRKHIQAAFAAGATDYVTKPFDILELSTRIRVASGLSSARHEAVESENQLSTFLSEASNDGHTSPYGSISILGIPNIIDFLLLSNFVLQLSFLETLSAHAFAVRINNFSDIVEHTSSADLYKILIEVGKPLSETLSGRNYLISYTGSGIFVCVASSVDWMTTDEVADMLEVDLEGLTYTTTQGESRSISVSVGNRVSNHLLTFDRRNGLILRAIRDVEKGMRRERIYNSKREVHLHKSMVQRLRELVHV